MKKLVVIVMLMMCTVAVSAQKWSITPEAGITAVKREEPKYLNMVSMQDKGWNARWKIGAAVEYAFQPEWFALKSGLYYTTRAISTNAVGLYDYTNTWDDLTIVNIKTTRHFLQMPLMVDFSFELANDICLHFAAGPYAALSIGEKQSTYYTGYKATDYGKYGKYASIGGYPSAGISDYNRFDWGASLQAGVEAKQWVINVGYEVSLGKEYKGGSSNLDVKYHTISLSVGYKFKLGK